MTKEPLPPDATALLLSQNLAGIFTYICENNLWNGRDSISGAGSDREQTRGLIEKFRRLLAARDIRSITDAPCGDFFWLREALPAGCRYVGCDVVESLARENQRRYGRTGVQFLRLDITRDPIPTADLVVCRDGLVHLSFVQALRALDGMRRCGGRYLLATTFPDRTANRDILSGLWRPLNLEKSPFRLPPPLELLTEGCTLEQGAFSDKALGLWRIEDIPGPACAPP